MKKVLALIFTLAAAALPSWAREVYLIGDATPSEWELSRLDKTKMTEVSTDVFEWTGILFKTNSEGFKILTQRDWNPAIHPSTGGLAINTAGSDVVALPYSNGTDSKWTVSETAEYKIRVTFRTSDVLVECTKVCDVVTDGFLQVSSADLLEDYAWKQNKGWIATADQKVALTADINLNSFSTWTPIGTDANKFIGTFDGQGHRITNMTIDGSKDQQGFFGVLGAGATIKNLIMDSSCTITSTGGATLAAFAGVCNNNGSITFENCGNEANVTGTQQNNAAFLGCNYGSTQLAFNNCYNTGTISGGWENGAFCGWCGGGASFSNCYNIGTVTEGDTWARGTWSIADDTHCYQTVGSNSGVTQVTADQIASGEICFKLNGDQSTIAWYQTIGTDTYPVPFSTGHSQVYANGEMNCAGEAVAGGTLTYSNESSSTIPPHSFEGGNGWCTVCHTLNASYLSVDGDGYYNIGTANDLNWFAEIIDKVNWQAKAKLTADIDYTSYKQGFIGKSQGSSFGGTFDGQEHTITIDMVNDGSTNRTALFAYIYGATIKNLVVEGSATSAGSNCIGGLGGRSDNTTTIENVIVKTAVSYTGSNGDATCGGILANAEGDLTIKNCAFLGSINTGTAEGNGGLVGYANSGSNNKYINCLVAPTAYTQNGNSGDFSRNNPTITNCLKVASNDARLASGELCYTLNAGGDNWYQDLGTDATPVPFSSHSKVYANASYYCDGTAKGAIVYANVNEEQHDPHILDNGFCTVCNFMVEYVSDYMTPAADGYYEISDNKQMRWFAAMIKDYRNVHNITANEDCNAPVNARLTADIDFADIKDFKPIGGLWGQGNTRYAGTFDGQHHKITNLVVDLNQDNVGVFGVISENAVIKNFTLDSSCSITGNGHVGIVGEIWHSQSGDVRLECLGNEADITGRNNNVGGILGVNMLNNSYAKLYMTNCYSIGTIKGNGENGQLSGWMGDHAVAENCYAIGDMTNCDGFARFGGWGTITNCYCDKNLTWDGHPTFVTNAQIASGELCAKLGDAFHQTIGTGHPVFDTTLPNVYEIAVTDAGYATFVPKKNIAAIPTGITAYVAQKVSTWLNLEAVSELPADNAVIVKASAGSYYCNSTEETRTISATNELTFSNTDIDADGTQFVLAKPEGLEVGFYKAASGKIAARKAYITSTSGVKAFHFDDDQTTGIESLNDNVNLNEGIYNLAGQRLQKMQKGINIVNGKKILF